MKRILAILLVLTLLVGCAGKGTEKEDKNVTNENSTSKTIKIGVTGSDSKVWKHVSEKVKDKGINLEVVYFDSYNLPNAALAQKEIDLNAFQHYSYLNKEINEAGYELSVIGDTIIEPMGIYSKSLKDLTNIEENSKIAIPDDPSNGGRALKVLESAGIIKINPEAGLLPTIKDITENPKNVEILELVATNIPPVLDELPLAVINADVAVDSGLIPEKDAIFLEKVETDSEKKNQYTNVIASRTEDKDREEFKAILKAYYTDEVKEIIKEESKGASVPVWDNK